MVIGRIMHMILSIINIYTSAYAHSHKHMYMHMSYS